jgi:hypothetical protein
MTPITENQKTMPPLSPEAQAVYDAFNKDWPDGLRASADLPLEVPVWIQGDSYWPYVNGMNAVREQLRAIANEIENLGTP